MKLQIFARAIAIFFCLMLMIGFGACGILGLAFMSETPFNLSIAGLTALGLGISAVCGFFLRKLIVSRKNSDTDKSEPG
ncbi:hypothetical protein [Undibacterium pigrum]|uniref:Uncharacterized protein n=1 Tax=Undibacterium pigrum TaxID=401470 RepID=A0A318J0Q5_9BURK|nr:hypothetical protein [Undibacterium pigrum]PXX40280.1 hypothetical protein DFR42_108114 [Undibacterium pigrum]